MKTFLTTVHIAAILSMGLFYASCASESSSDISQDDTVKVTTVEVESADFDKYVANISIEGMSCEMMCGSKISSTLAALDGVKNTEIDFQAAGEANFAIVEYDAKTISEQEMIAAVQGIAGGIYKVNAVKVTHHKMAAAEIKKSDRSKMLSYKQADAQYRLPNIFSALAFVLR